MGRVPAQSDRAPRQPVTALPAVPSTPGYRVWLRQWARGAAERQGSFQSTDGDPSEATAAAAVLHEVAGPTPAAVVTDFGRWLVARIRSGLATKAKRWQWALT
eukprot:3636583-Lingulodinium_polyedra.AAC.1